jgi:hypothetical protein
VYEKTGTSAWTLRGNIKGPQGPTGATGSQGIQGVAGTPGEKWFTGSGVPTVGGAPAGAVVGDWYLNSANGDYYERTGPVASWDLRGNLRGPQGVAGPATLETYIGTAAPSPRGDYTVWVDTDEPDPTPFAVEALHVIGAAGEPGFGAGWSDYLVGTFGSTSFYKDRERVFLRGLVKKSSAVVSPDTIFTLPVGYRPSATVVFPIISNAALGRLDVLATGAVQVITGSNVWVAIYVFSFRV